MKILQATIPEGPNGIRVTLNLMGRLAAAAQAEPWLYILARRIVAPAAGKDHAAEAALIYRWVQQHIAYRWDPADHEALQTPANTVALRAGDCDDMTTLIVALARSIGLRTRMMVGGRSKGHYIHVWPEVWAGGRWLALDATERRGPGWRPPLPYLMAAMPRG